MMVGNGAGMGLLTAMIVVFVIIGRQKLIKHTKHNSARRSCLSSDKKHKTKKKVHFAADIVEPRHNNREYRERRIPAKMDSETWNTCPSTVNGFPHKDGQSIEKTERKIPANRVALYNGILRYRLQQASLYR